MAVVQGSYVHALPSFLDPQKGSTPEEEMLCYSLPYGALGFISHIITYYTLVCLWLRRRPLWPSKEMNNWKWDLLLGIGSCVLPVALAIFTIVRCRNGWQFLLIGIWKMFMSALLGITAIVAALSTRPVMGIDTQPQNTSPGSDTQNPAGQYELSNVPAEARRNLTDKTRLNPPSSEARKRKNYSLLGLLIYVPGLIAGLTGLFSLVKQNWHSILAVRLITFTMWSVAGAIGVFFVMAAVLIARGSVERTSLAVGTLIVYAVTAVGVVGALYSDWILGAIGGNFGGVPSGDNPWLYWVYFFTKKLPLGSM